MTVFLALALVYPYIEAWITGDHREHHLLDRPRNAPTRTAIGVAGIAFYGVLWGAAGSDLIATQLGLGLESVDTFLRVALLAAPVVAFSLTRRICRALQKKDRELVLHGVETGRIVRFPGGEFVEVHKPLDDYERWRLVEGSGHAPLQPRPDENGKVGWTTRLRVQLARFFFEDRISPVPSSELE